MAAKAVVRDVARVQGKSYGLADKLSKLIPFEVGMTLAKALEQESTIRDFLAEDSDAQEIWDMAVQLEGTTRNVGKHAGGVVIAPVPGPNSMTTSSGARDRLRVMAAANAVELWVIVPILAGSLRKSRTSMAKGTGFSAAIGLIFLPR